MPARRRGLLGKPEDALYSEAEVRGLARSISARTGKPVFLTRGEYGIVVADDGAVHEIPGIQVLGETDTVGAGDTVVAALAAALGSGQDALLWPPGWPTRPPWSPCRSCKPPARPRRRRFWRWALRRIISLSPNWRRRRTSRDSSRARISNYVGELPQDLAIEHCIFDHDGTLSVLREGWESVMEPMMVRAILGPAL